MSARSASLFNKKLCCVMLCYISGACIYTHTHTDITWALRHFKSLRIRMFHYNDVIMGAMASHITSLTIVYSTVYSGADERKHQSSASLAFVRGSHRWPVNSPHKWPVTRKMFRFDDVIMCSNTCSGKHQRNTKTLHHRILRGQTAGD